MFSKNGLHFLLDAKFFYHNANSTLREVDLECKMRLRSVAAWALRRYDRPSSKLSVKLIHRLRLQDYS